MSTTQEPKKRAPRPVVIATIGERETREIAALKPFKRNPRIHPQSQIDALVKAFKKFGFTQPILVDSDNTILAGHGRVIAAKQMGMKEIPVYPCPAEWDEATKKAYVIADNQITSLAQWDESVLSLEMKDLKRMEFPLANLGFEMSTLKKLIAEDITYPSDLHDEIDAEGEAAPAEDFNVAEDELAGEGRDPLAAVPDDEKPRYHQLPPDDATRAIRASEERIPLAILLSRSEHDKWEEFKATAGHRTDASAFRSLMGWTNDTKPSPQLAEQMAKAKAA